MPSALALIASAAAHSIACPDVSRPLLSPPAYYIKFYVPQKKNFFSSPFTMILQPQGSLYIAVVCLGGLAPERVKAKPFGCFATLRSLDSFSPASSPDCRKLAIASFFFIKRILTVFNVVFRYRYRLLSNVQASKRILAGAMGIYPLAPGWCDGFKNLHAGAFFLLKPRPEREINTYREGVRKTPLLIGDSSPRSLTL